MAAYVNNGTFTGYVEYFRKGTISENTITWGNIYEFVSSGTRIKGASLAVSTTGRMFAAYETNSDQKLRVAYSDNNGDSWTSTIVMSSWPVSSVAATLQIIPRSSGRMMLIVEDAYYHIDWFLYDGSSWGSFTDMGFTLYSNGAGLFCAGSWGDTVYLAYSRSSTSSIHATTYTTSWSSPVVLQSSIVVGCFPVLSVVPPSPIVYVFWAGKPTANQIVYKRNIGGTWDTNPTVLVDESTDGLTANNLLTVARNDVTLMYETKVSSPYNIKVVTFPAIPPSFGAFTVNPHSAPNTVYPLFNFRVNATIAYSLGATPISVGLELNSSVVLNWTSSSSFSISSGSSVCSLSVADCVYSQLNSTSYRFSWMINLTEGYVSGLTDVVSATTVDSVDNSVTTSQGDLFEFKYFETPILSLPSNIYNADSQKWVFVAEKAYSFLATWKPYNNLDVLSLSFTDGLSWFNASYNNPSSSWSSIVTGNTTIAYIDSGKTTTTISGYAITISFPIIFSNDVLDSQDRNLYVFGNTTSGKTYNWTLAVSNAFNIYNLGGLTFIELSGLSSRAGGGDVFEVNGEDDSSAYVYQYWKNLKSIEFMFNLRASQSSTWNLGDDPAYNQTFTVSWGIDYVYEGHWVTGFVVSLTGPKSDSVLTVGAGAKRTVCWWIEFFYKGESIKGEYIRTYPDAGGVEGTEPVWTGLILDIWFNSANASSLIGARIQAEYYPMVDTANWLSEIWSGGDWAPEKFSPPYSMAFTALTDDDGNIFSSKNLKLMRLWENLTIGAQPFAPTYDYVDSFQIFEIRANDPTMGGINTPSFTEIRTPNMPQTGIWGAIVSALSGLGGLFVTALISGLGSIALGFMGLMDMVIGLLGIQNGFSNFIAWLGFIFTKTVQGMIWVIQLLYNIFLLLVYAVPFGLSVMASTVLNVISIFTSLWSIWLVILDFFSGVWIVYIAPFYNIFAELFPYAIGLYVVYLGYLGATGQGQKALNNVKFLYNTAKWLVHISIGFFEFIMKIADFGIQIIQAINPF